MESKKKKYGEIKFLHPEGHIMFIGNETKANWYLSRNLAKITKSEISQTGEIEIKELQMTFTPKGKGHKLSFYLNPLKDICVVCGDSNYENLTRHHVFPECYRDALSSEFKSHNNYDIFRLCDEHHTLYEKHALQLKRQISEEYNVLNPGNFIDIEFKESKKLIGMAKLLLNNTNIPESRKEFFYEEICKKLKKSKEQITEYDLNQILVHFDKKTKVDKKNLHGYQVMQKVEDIQKFVERWRSHFIEYAKPKFLPEFWKIDEKNYTK